MVAAYPYRIWIAVNYELDEHGSSCQPNQSWLLLLQYAFDLANADPVHVCRLVSRHPVFYPTPEPR